MLWTQSPPDTIFRSVYERNMDDSSFNENQKSMEKTISHENQAFFGDSNFVTGNKVMACKVQ